MSFEPDSRLLDLLVGSNLYPAPDVCVRELLQNAWDAIEWRRNLGDGAGGQIGVRFHPAQGWFEVEDDGIGMDEHDIESSFVKVGRDKLEALDAQATAGEQVAFFGIGILSVFLVADSVDVSTKKLNAARGVRVEIAGLQSEIRMTEEDRETVDTSLRVHVRPGQPFTPAHVVDATRKYARHVPGVSIAEFDHGNPVGVADTSTRRACLQSDRLTRQTP